METGPETKMNPCAATRRGFLRLLSACACAFALLRAGSAREAAAAPRTPPSGPTARDASPRVVPPAGSVSRHA